MFSSQVEIVCNTFHRDLKHNYIKPDRFLIMLSNQILAPSLVISQHVCEHWNYLVCFVENGICRNCDWKTPDLLNTANWIIFWLRLDLCNAITPVATSKEEYLKNQNIVNNLMEIENSVVVLPPENFYRSCRRFGDNQW